MTRTKMEDECVLYKTGDEKETFVCLGAFEASVSTSYFILLLLLSFQKAKQLLVSK